jgi:Flp pilus assembly protein TadD
MAAGERSVTLSPNHADNAANLGCSYAVSGRPADAVAAMKRAMRLSPVYPAWYLNILGFAHYVLGEFDQAESAVRLALEREPGYAECRLILAAAHHARGRLEEARREAQEVLRRDPAFRLSGFAARLSIVKDRALVVRLVELLRSLGLQ